MSKRYPGGIIRKTPQTPSQTSAQGVWGMTDVTQAQLSNTWPIAGLNQPVSRSLRFRASASANLTRTPAIAGTSTKMTFSFWLKRGILSTAFQNIITSGASAGGGDAMIFTSGDAFRFWLNGGSSSDITTSQVFRDPSAWYHIVVAIDTTQATSSNRVKIYVNGSQVTAFSSATYPNLNYTVQYYNTTTQQQIGYGVTTGSGGNYFDGYQTEINFIDGQALTPSSFGASNPFTGVWQPAPYTGSYGTNGFYLPFSDVSSLGRDFSGNSNNWTTNNISTTSGSTYDSMVDVPTQWLPYNTAGDVGGVVRGNYCVLNPIASAVADTYSQANLRWTKVVNTTNTTSVGSIAISSGKWYWEGTVAAHIGSNITIGIGNTDTSFVNLDSNLGMTGSTTSYAYNGLGLKQNNNSQPSYGATFTTNDVIGVAFDADAGTLTFYKNNTSQGTAYTGITGTYYPACGGRLTNDSWYMNFGQRPFSYTPPSGFKSLNTFNLPTPTIGATASTQANKYMDATLYTGTGTTAQNIVNAGSFQPDFVWIKSRSNAYYNELFDVIRGVNKPLFSNDTLAEASRTGMTAFNSNGFTVQDNGTTNQGTNAPSATFVGWQWKANGSGSSNTSGSITSTVSANTSAGFSIVNWSGSTSTSAQTVGHGLGVAPVMVILKNRNLVDNWWVFFSGITSTSQTLSLNTTGAVTTQGSAFWGAGMTSTVVGVRPNSFVNSTSDNVIMYCFAAVAGYSAFGSYTGNGSTDGPFVFTGFRPKFIMLKNSTSAASWSMLDTSRNTYNISNARLFAESSQVEDTSQDTMDILSNGFKLRATGLGVNGSGSTIIYMAFAENPFKFSLAR